MLMELSVRNFALIEEVHLSLESGLNIVTGETGAGKSILLDAVSLILGGRASHDFVRQGTDKATIEALFAVDKTDDLLELCEDYGIEMEEGTLLIVREISTSGKNVCRVNGRMVTVQMLKHFGQYLINMHGQHEHQTLSDMHEQLALLDSYGGEEVLTLREEVAALYDRYRQAKIQLRNATVGEQERVQRIDMLEFQLKEIQEARLRPGEEGQLEEERKRLAHSEKLFAASSTAYELLYSGESRNSSTLDKLNTTLSSLEGVSRYDESLLPVIELVKTALYNVEEAAHTLRGYRDQVEFNPDRLDKIEDRLNTLRRLRKKYGDSAEEILAYAAEVQQELGTLENFEENIERLTREVGQAGTALAKRAIALSKARRACAERLSEAMTEELAALMMPKIQFAISFTQIQEEDGIPIGGRNVHCDESGIDRVEFLFSPNVGEPLRPLAKIASGGELSRTMLALKTILAAVDDVGTLIFDEVDTGISGRAAQAVAEKLAIVAAKRQVICVTHLPQVASMADTHYLIQKSQTASRTFTELLVLGEQERIEELARMLSGAELTEATLRHAEEMLERARLLKNTIREEVTV